MRRSTQPVAARSGAAGVDGPGRLADDRPMDPTDDLDAREAERIRRRDREAAAEQRELMKPGMGKVFKQIQDRQRKAADETAPPADKAPRKRPRI
jgi:hypothetical protein